MVLLDWIIFRPQSILLAAVVILSGAITALLVMHDGKSRSGRWLACFFVANTLASIFHFLTEISIAAEWEPRTDALTLFFYLVGAACLYRFAYQFPEPLAGQEREARLAGRLSLALLFIGGLGGIDFMVRFHHPSFMVLLGMNALAFFGIIIVFYRRAVSVLRAHQPAPRISPLQLLRHLLSGELMKPARGMRGFMLVMTLYFSLSTLAGVYWNLLYTVIPQIYWYLFLSAGLFLFLFFFVQVYLTYSTVPTTFMTKMLMGTLTMVLFSVALMGTLFLYRQDQQITAQAREMTLAIKEKIVEKPEAEILEAGVFPPAAAFVFYHPIETLHSAAAQNGSLFVSFQEPAHVQLLMSRDVAFSPETLLWSAFMQQDSQHVQAHTGNTPEETYYLYTFTSGPHQYTAGFQAAYYRDRLNPMGLQALLLLILFGASLFVVFPYFYRKSLVIPMNELMEGLQQVNEGNLSAEVPVFSMDEVGQLSQSFNQMTRSLERAKNSLQRYNVALEQEVENRTEELVNSLEESERLRLNLAREQALLKTTIMSMHDALVTTDREGKVLMMNGAAENLTGWTLSQALGKPFATVVTADETEDGEQWVDPVKEIVTGGSSTIAAKTAYLHRPNGERLPIEYSAASIMGKEDNSSGAIFLFRDYSEKRHKEKEVLRLTLRDQLTGVFNRRFFDEELKRAAHVDNMPVALLVIDMDGLKLFNDALGHKAGDEALITVAESLQRVLRDGDIIARTGGDEFVVILPKTDQETTNQITQRIHLEIWDGSSGGFQLSVSIGSALWENEHTSMREVLKQAEDRMYRHKLSSSPYVQHQNLQGMVEKYYKKFPHEKSHALQVANLSSAIGKELGYEQAVLSQLHLIGRMHEIGKIALATAELAPLSGDESGPVDGSVHRHAEIGYHVLRSTHGYSNIAESILALNEWWDGSGTPKGLSGNSIPREAQIAAIADAWVNQLVEHEGKKAGVAAGTETASWQKALAAIRQLSGARFDPELVNALASLCQKPAFQSNEGLSGLKVDS